MALRRNPPAYNPREGFVAVLKERERKTIGRTPYTSMGPYVGFLAVNRILETEVYLRFKEFRGTGPD